MRTYRGSSVITPIRVLLVEDDEEDYTLIRDLLREEAADQFEIDWASSYDGAVVQSREQPYDAFLVDYRLGRRSGLDLLCGALKGGRVGPVIIVTGHDMHEIDVEARKLGAAGFLVKSELSSKHLARTLRYAVEAFATKGSEPVPAVEPGPRRAGRVIAVVGAKGGVGTTTVVANIACALRARDLSVCAIEMRGDHGNLSRLLDVVPLSDIGALLKLDAAEIDDASFQSNLALQPDGLRVLPAPRLAEEFGEIRAEHARAIVETALRSFDLVVIDLPSSASAANREVLGLADAVALVLEKDSCAVSAAGAMLSLLESWQVRAPIGSVVVTRTALPESQSVAQINSELGLKRLGVVPCAPELFHKAAANREPVVVSHRAHPAGRSLDELAHALLRQPVDGWRPRSLQATSNSEVS
jgi:MinD-like ATPase involved in chromosome partitioning or flagellar assembly/CheY-like chemotaxis protein